MEVRELKRRGRSLLAWMLVFSLIAGVIWLDMPLSVLAAGSLTVQYKDTYSENSSWQSVSYEKDENTSTVTVDTSEVKLPEHDNVEFLSWEINFSNSNSTDYIPAGQSKTYDWDSLFSSGEAGEQLTLDANTTWAYISVEATLNENDSATVSHGETSYTIKPPSTIPTQQ